MSKKIKGIIYIVVGVSPIVVWSIITTGIMATLGILAATSVLAGFACLIVHGICLIQE